MAVHPRDAYVSVAGHSHSGLTNKMDVFEPGADLESVTLGVMGSEVLDVVGAKLARPERAAVVLSGDDVCSRIKQDLETCVRERSPTVCVVFDDLPFSILKVFQNAFYGDRVIGSGFSNISFHTSAEALAALANTAERGEDVRPAIERPLASGRPASLHVQVDPAEIGPTGIAVQQLHAHTGGQRRPRRRAAKNRRTFLPLLGIVTVGAARGPAASSPTAAPQKPAVTTAVRPIALQQHRKLRIGETANACRKAYRFVGEGMGGFSAGTASTPRSSTSATPAR